MLWYVNTIYIDKVTNISFVVFIHIICILQMYFCNYTSNISEID